MTVYRPVAPPRISVPRRAAAALDTSRPMRLALVANGKPNSTELLTEVAAELGRQFPEIEVRHYRKGSVSIPLEPHEVAEIAEWASAVLAAIGD